MDDGVYYDPEQRRSPLLKVIIIVLCLVILIIMILLLIKPKNKIDLYDKLVTMTKNNLLDDDYPKEIGDCKTISLESINKSNEKEFNSCDGNKTYVKVCKLNDDKIWYTPVLSCGRIYTSFDEWKTGTVDDIIDNNSEIEIYFEGEVLENGIRKFYPNDEINVSKVNEYYETSPKEEYVYKINPKDAYKWYLFKDEKDYYNNGEYVSIKPDGYEFSENEKIKTYFSLNKPNNMTFRKISDIILYATEMHAYPYSFECIDNNLEGMLISKTICELRKSDSYKTTRYIHYTCDGVNETTKDTLCSKRSNWTSTSCYENTQTAVGETIDGYSYTRNPWTGYVCIKTDGYLIEDTEYQWYNNVSTKKYYPSDSKNMEDEITYYVDAPLKDAIKDESSKTKVYQYFKLEESSDTTPTWVHIGSNNMDKQTLINSFNELGYSVDSLNSIDENKNTKYEIVLKYRNRK